MQRSPGNQNLENIRHSLAHVLAAAVLEKFPETQLGIGPVIENGFYYDFKFKKPVSEEMLPELEKSMKKIINQGLPFKGKKLTPATARTTFKGQPFKLDLIKDFIKDKKQLTAYKTGDIFNDLCRGGHVKNTNEIDPSAFKLTHLAGAYWKGDEKKAQLTRIYGAAFNTKKELSEYLKQQEEAKKRDHRKLGKELDLFTFSDLVGSGFPLYTPKGAFIRLALNNYIENIQSKQGYQQVWTPQVAKADLFKTSGHYDKYKDDMFRVNSNYSKEEFYLKPMNCPQHTQIYVSKARSYKDLPIRITDFAMLYRDEKPGELLGLSRVRSFSQDDCHIFCREDQVDEEIDKALAMTKEVMKACGLKYKYRLSTRDPEHPEKYLGDPKTWDKVEKWAEKIMQRNKIEHYDAPGEAAFYAPKMDLVATDALGREWQLSTVQIDYVMPERFGLEYTDHDSKKKRPVMLHRAIIGSPERFIMVLLEHFNGALPLWLSPVQAWVLPIGQKQSSYAKKINKELQEAGIRTELHEESDTIGKRIRTGEMQKIPYLLIVGDKEVKAKTVNVRSRGKKETTEEKLASFLKKLQTEIEKKK